MTDQELDTLSKLLVKLADSTSDKGTFSGLYVGWNKYALDHINEMTAMAQMIQRSRKGAVV